MKGIASLLLFGFILATFHGHVAFGADWLTDFLGGINQMNYKLQQDLQRMNQQIQENVHAQVSRINQDVNSQVARIHQDVNAQVARTNENVAEALKNIDKGQVTHISGNGGGQSIVVTGNGGNSRTVHSGKDANGQPYYVESENLVVGDTLFHTDRVYNYTTKKLDEKRYTLDLSDPKAKPVYTDGSALA